MTPRDQQSDLQEYRLELLRQESTSGAYKSVNEVGKGFVELLEGGDCLDILLEVVGSQHLVGDDGKHGGDETVASLEQRCVRKSFTMIFLIIFSITSSSDLSLPAPHFYPPLSSYDFYGAICLILQRFCEYFG